MVNPCNLCNGKTCCNGKDEYCSNSECCDPFICLCSGLVIKDEISSE